MSDECICYLPRCCRFSPIAFSHCCLLDGGRIACVMQCQVKDISPFVLSAKRVKDDSF